MKRWFLGQGGALPSWPFLWLLNLAAVASPPALAEGGLYLRQEAFGHSEALPLAVVLDGWQLPRRSGELSHGFNWSETGYYVGPLQVGLVYRREARLRYHPDTVELLHRVKNHQSLDVGRKHILDLAVNEFEARGVRLQYRLPLGAQVSLDLGASYLQATWLTSGHLRGEATVTGEKDYDFAFEVDYLYSEDGLFERPLPSHPQGWGYAYDFQVHWTPANGVAMDITVTDLFARLVWPEAPRTRAQGDSSFKVYDDHGFLKFNPVFSGRETTERFVQRLEPRADLRMRFGERQWSLLNHVLFTDDQAYFAWGLGYAPSHRARFGLLHTLNTGALTLTVQGRWFEISFAADDWRRQRLHNVALGMGLRLPLH